jgi:hypothetical protein
MKAMGRMTRDATGGPLSGPQARVPTSAQILGSGVLRGSSVKAAAVTCAADNR